MSDASSTEPPAKPASPASPDDVADDLAKIPRLPRSGGFKLSTADLVKIGFTAAILVMVIVIRKPCSDAVSNFVTDFDGSGGSATHTQMPKPDNIEPGTGSGSNSTATGSAVDPCQVSLHTGMSEAETLAAIERAKACSAARKSGGSGSGEPGSGSVRP